MKQNQILIILVILIIILIIVTLTDLSRSYKNVIEQLKIAEMTYQRKQTQKTYTLEEAEEILKQQSKGAS
jgi:Sec-independent protein translocase protein TatA